MTSPPCHGSEQPSDNSADILVQLATVRAVPDRRLEGLAEGGRAPQDQEDGGQHPTPASARFPSRLVVEAIRRQLPPGNDPEDLVLTGPGGGPGRPGGPSVPRGARTVLSRHNLHRTYQGALAKLADPAVPLRPTARRVLKALREGGAPARRPARRPTGRHRPPYPADHDRDRPSRAARRRPGDVRRRRPESLYRRSSALPIERDPLLDAVDLHGAHDFRHTYATWLEDAGIPARVIGQPHPVFVKPPRIMHFHKLIRRPLKVGVHTPRVLVQEYLRLRLIDWHQQERTGSTPEGTVTGTSAQGRT